jgi:DNA-binding MarR family transcriptional regulator
MADIDPKTMEFKLHGAPHSKASLRVWLKLLSCTMLTEKAIRNRLSETFETTLPRFDVMAALDRYPDGISMGDLSKVLMVSNGNITGIVTRLAEEGLVKRASLEHDRRTFYVTITPEGRGAFNRMALVHEQWVDGLFGKMTDGDLEVLTALLTKLRGSIAADLKTHKE